MHNQGSARTISDTLHDGGPATEIKEVQIRGNLVDDSLSKTAAVDERLTVFETIGSITIGTL